MFSWWNESVSRIRPGTKTVRGATVPDWDNATAKTIYHCHVQPSGTSLSQDGRILGISDSLNLYMPSSADVQEGDRISYGGETYTVMGVPRNWVSPAGNVTHKQVTLERWSG